MRSQRSDQEQFLFEGTVEMSVRDAVRDLAIVNNLRQRITRLKLEGEELAKHGPAKQPDKQGLDEYADEGQVERGTHYTADPTGRRTGNGRQQGSEARQLRGSGAEIEIPIGLLSATVSGPHVYTIVQLALQTLPRSCSEH